MEVNKGAAGRGRPKGALNKVNMALKDRISKFGCDPFEVLADIANGKLKCGVCFGKGKTRFQPAKGEDRSSLRPCQSCWESGFERISPAERCKAASELAGYLECKRKAVEHSGPDGGPMQAKVEVIFVKP